MTDKVAIVTGGGRGIGRGIVDRLLTEGYAVATCGRGSWPKDLPDGVVWETADVSDPKAAERVLQACMDAYGPPDLLVNNAGVQLEKTLIDSTDADFDHVIGVNCRGVFNMCRAILPGMSDRGGSIVNIGSISGVVSDPSLPLYNASKAFVHGLTRSIAVDHGPKVRCNAIRPGWIMTEMAVDAFALANDPEAAKRDALSRHAAGRFGAPADIAEAVVWLASPASAFVTGQCITVDGGLTSASPLNPGLF